MRQEDFLSFLRRLHDRQANLQRRHTPRATVPDWLVANDGSVEFFQLSTPGRTANQWDFLSSLVAVHVKSELRLSDIASFTGRD